MSEDQAKAEQKSKVTTVIGIASVVWLLVCIWLFWISASCDIKGVGFYERNLKCLSPNEMGDFLAGAFAPLAFLWLIAAVFLQRNELAAQRQELRDSRAVATQQVEEARRNVEFIAQQTKILEENQKQEKAEATDDRIDGLIDMFISKMLVMTRGPLLQTAEDVVSKFQRGKQSMHLRVDGELDRYKCIENLSNKIDAEISRYNSHYGNLRQNASVSPYLVSEALYFSKQIDDLVSDASPSRRDRLAFISWSDVTPALHRLGAYIGDADEMWKDGFAQALTFKRE